MTKILSFWLLLIFAVLSWTSWYIVYTNVSPITSANIALPLFYATFFLATSFSWSILMALIWKIFCPTKSPYICIRNGIREGSFLGIGSTICLFFLQHQNLGNIELITIFSLVFLLELFFISRD